ncbi:unnamed protein product, partial [Symbiodinium pilosum]
YQVNEAAFQTEYQHLFPSRRILGERGRDPDRDGRDGRRDGRRQVRFEDEGNADGELDEFLDALGNEEQLPDEQEDETMVGRELRDLQVRSQVPENEESDNLVEPPPELRRELYRIHRNLGHPDDQTFCRALRHAGVKLDIIKWVKKKPGTHRPAHLSRQMEFNAVVGIDLAVLGGWHKFFGPPAMVVVDQGKEFASRTFSEAIGAPLKTVINKILDERTACSPEEFSMAVDAAVWTPYALLSDDAMDHDLVNHVHSDDMRKAQAVRNKTLQAWAGTQDESAIKRAVSTRTRTTDQKELVNGDTVYVWRHTVDYVGWVGPGVVVNQTDN